MTDSRTYDDTPDPIPKAFACIWLAALLAIAVFIRVHGVDYYAYSPDERVQVDMPQGKTLAQVWQFSFYETHPPLGNFLRHFWMKLSGDVAFARSEMLLFGILTILLYYAIGKHLYGRLCGMTCATLVAFSHGCVTLSYIARNYMLFLFLISLGFYCYLLWRSSGRKQALAGYVVCGMLSVATHFSAVFFIMGVGIHEMLSLLKRRASLRSYLVWSMANAAIMVPAVILYALWRPTLVLLQSYFDLGHTYTPAAMAFFTLLYPLATAMYLFPGYKAALLLTVLLAAIAFAPGRARRITGELKSLLQLMGIGFAIGMVMFITGFYTLAGTRHGIWIFPLVLPAAGALLAIAITRPAERFRPLLPQSWPQYAALTMLLCGWAAYSPKERFADESEYLISQRQQEELERALANLGPADLIVTERDTALMITNVYPYLGDDAFRKEAKALSIPYAGTHILIDPFHHRLRTGAMLVDMLNDARAKHTLDGVDRLVFFYSAWPQSIMERLILCPALDKNVISFTPAPFSADFSSRKVDHAPAMLLTIPLRTFYSELIAPAGKAHQCLEEKDKSAPVL